MNRKRKIPFPVLMALLVLVICGVVGGILAYRHSQTEDTLSTQLEPGENECVATFT